MSLRFPWAHGTALRAGRYFMSNQSLSIPNQKFFTTISLQDHESPNNNQIGHSYLFHYGFPLSFGAVGLQSFLDSNLMLSLTSLHDWDKLIGDEAGHGGLVNLSIHGPNFMSNGFSLMAGTSEGESFFLLNFQNLMCWPATSSCSLNNPNSAFNLGLEGLFGGQQKGTWQGLDIMGRANFHPIIGLSSRQGTYMGDLYNDYRNLFRAMWGTTPPFDRVSFWQVEFTWSQWFSRLFS